MKNWFQILLHPLWKKVRWFLVRSSPRWLVFTIDVILAVIAFWFAFIIRFNFNIKFHYTYFWIQWLIYIVVSAAAFLIFKPHVGVIRYTGWKDIAKIFKSSLLTAAVLMILTQFSRAGYLSRAFNFPYSVIFLASFFQFFFLSGARILYKTVYYKIIRANRKEENVLIVGTGIEAIHVSEILAEHPAYKFNIKGFITEKDHYAKSLKGYPIIPLKKIDEKFLERNQISRVILADSTKSPLDMLELANYFSAPGIKVHRVPPPEKWMSDILRFEDIKEFDIEALLERPPLPRDDEGILTTLKGKIIWVTGAAGSIGSELSRQILQYEPAMVYLLDQAETPLYELELELRKKYEGKFQTILIDIFDTEHIRHIFEHHRPDIIFHAAAYKHVPVLELHPYDGIAVNILATKHLMETAGQYGVERFIQISTDKAVNPTNVMGATKRVAELIARCMQEKYPDTQYIVTRFGNVLGSNGSVIHLFKKQIREGGPLTVTHPDINRFFMTIPEASHLVLKAAQIGKGGQIYVFDMGKPVKIVDLAIKMIRLSGKRYPDDIQIKFTGLRPGEKISEEILTAKEKVENQVHQKLFISKLAPLNCKKLDDKLRQLEEAFKEFRINDCIRIIKEIVPEYKSHHSRFESLDR